MDVRELSVLLFDFETEEDALEAAEDVRDSRHLERPAMDLEEPYLTAEFLPE